MTRDQLIHLIRSKKSFLCVGLDSDVEKIPPHLLAEPDPLFAFNKAIIDATLPYAVAYKPNLAFYEAAGSAGIVSLEKTITYLNNLPEKVFTIADAKRGDIGNTARCYAKAYFETIPFDAVTLSPYMGMDTIAPYLEYPGKWAIVLALTSNEGSQDFQLVKPQSTAFLEKLGIKFCHRKDLFELVIERSLELDGADRVMFVVGATQGEMIKAVRDIAPGNFLLVPGVGAQGGSLEMVADNGMNKDCGLLVNASRSIIYASSGIDFQQSAAEEARKLQQQMAELLLQHQIIRST